MLNVNKIVLLTGAIMASVIHADFLREPLKDPGLECANYDSEGWLTIYDGSQASAEKYWWVSNSSHGNGGNWYVAEDPALVTAGKLKAGQKIIWSNQNPGGNGGILYSQRRYKDFEVRVSFFPGWKNDGGLFLRSNGKGQAWQVMFDYRPGGTVGGIWPEGLSGPSQDYYSLATETKVDARLAKWNMADWPKIWDADGFNMVHAKVTGEPSLIKAYMTDSNYTITDYQTTTQSVITETGYIGLQIHAGEGSWQGGPNKYQWMKVRELTPGTGKPICPATTNPPTTRVKSSATPNLNSLQLSVTSMGSKNLSIAGRVAEEYQMSLLDMQGRVLETRHGNAGMVSQTFSGLEKGIYVVNISTPKSNHNYKAASL
jgi:hypothetical protein